MGKRVNIALKTVFSCLTVVEEYHGNDLRGTNYICVCECGNEKIIRGASLLNGRTRSCGCLQKKELTERNKTHGLSDTRLYRTWKDMRKRCDNPKSKSYLRYGGRGIKYDPLFKTFEGFLAGIPSGYNDSVTLDRIDNNDNYRPGNLKWSTNKEQSNNKSTNRPIVDPETGKETNLQMLSEKYGLHHATVARRLKIGATVSEALEPIKRRGPRTLSDEKVREVKRTLWFHDVEETSMFTGVSKKTVNRIRNGDAYCDVSDFE